jgi:hypothetical protein
MHSSAPDPMTLATVPLARLKSLARRILSFVGLNIRFAVTPGVSLLGFNVFVDDRPGPPKRRSQCALEAVLRL